MYRTKTDIEGEQFNARLWADNKTRSASEAKKGIINAFLEGFRAFWGVEGETTVHTQEEMQEIIDDMPDALDILMDARKFRQFAESAFPGEVVGKYAENVFEITVVEGRIIVGKLSESWTPAEPVEVVPEVPVPEEIVSHAHLAQG